MNLRQTAEVAALAALRAEEIVERAEPVSMESLHAYWKASRMRLRCWIAGLRTIPGIGEIPGTPSPLLTMQRVSVSRSILVAELLTRVWSSVLLARDAVRMENVATAVVRNVTIGQLEARREVLQLLADEDGLPEQEAAGLDRLRRRVERWTDLLLGPLVRKYGICEFTFDEERALTSVLSFPVMGRGSSPDVIEQLTLLGLSQAIPRNGGEACAASVLDWAVARTVLSALSHSTGCPKE